jgi:hypothetical protein
VRRKSRRSTDSGPNAQADLLLAGRLMQRWLWGGLYLGCPFTLDD